LRRAPRLRPVEALARAVTDVFAIKGELDYWAAARHAELAAPLAEELAAHVRLGQAAEATAPLAKAIELLLSTLDIADDTSGTLDDLLNRLLATHAEACRQAPPAGLSDWLLHVQFDAGRWCPVDITAYGPALGETELELYRAGVRRRWAADPGDLSARDAVERLARWQRDMPTLIEVIGGDLRHAAQYGRLARALAEIGEPATALEWARRGLAAHPDDPPGAGLRAFLAKA
jgi:tetratricopeptide (TPR) repeat protein